MEKSPEFSPSENGLEGKAVKIIALCRVPDSKVLGYFLDQESCDDFARGVKDATTGTMSVEAKKIGDKYYIKGQEVMIEK